MIYTRVLKPTTWNEVKTFDDIIIKGERAVLRYVEEKARKENLAKCPELGKEGKNFYFCKKGYIPRAGDEKPSSASQIYQKHIDSSFLQLFCFGRCEKCCTYQGKLKR